MKTLSSRENPLYKDLKQLTASSQAQRKSGRALLEGVHLCEAYLKHVGMPALCVVGDSARGHPEVAPLLGRCAGSSCVALPDALYHALSQVENGIDILFVIDTPDAPPVMAVDAGAVLLDKLQDPGNLGSILRSAAAAGIRKIFCSPETAYAWSPKVLRAGMGAHFLLTIAENVALLPLMREATIPVIATSPHAETTLYQMELTQPAAWLFGHEGQGVADELLALASHRVAIPHAGEVESLNVAASAAVCFFEQMRQQSAVATPPGAARN